MVDLRTLALAVALIGAAPALGVGTPAGSAAEDLRYREMLHQGDMLLAKRQPALAIARYFDPVIAAYARQYATSKQQVYGARSGAESLFYITLAVGEGRSAVVISPTWGDALYFKAFALVDLGRAAEAKPLFERAIALSPSNSRYLSELGNLYQGGKNWPKALQLFTQSADATRFTPAADRTTELTRAWRGQGYALAELGRYDQATALYRKCLALDPGEKSAKAELAYLQRLRSRSPPTS